MGKFVSAAEAVLASIPGIREYGRQGAKSIERAGEMITAGLSRGISTYMSHLKTSREKAKYEAELKGAQEIIEGVDNPEEAAMSLMKYAGTVSKAGQDGIMSIVRGLQQQDQLDLQAEGAGLRRQEAGALAGEREYQRGRDAQRDLLEGQKLDLAYERDLATEQHRRKQLTIQEQRASEANQRAINEGERIGADPRTAVGNALTTFLTHGESTGAGTPGINERQRMILAEKGYLPKVTTKAEVDAMKESPGWGVIKQTVNTVLENVYKIKDPSDEDVEGYIQSYGLKSVQSMANSVYTQSALNTRAGGRLKLMQAKHEEVLRTAAHLRAIKKFDMADKLLKTMAKIRSSSLQSVGEDLPMDFGELNKQMAEAYEQMISAAGAAKNIGDTLDSGIVKPAGDGTTPPPSSPDQGLGAAENAALERMRQKKANETK